MLGNLGKGAVVGGLAAMLFGTKSGRKLSGKLLAVGSVVDEASPVERAYLDQLREAMKLDQGMVDQIRLQMHG